MVEQDLKNFTERKLSNKFYQPGEKKSASSLWLCRKKKKEGINSLSAENGSHAQF